MRCEHMNLWMDMWKNCLNFYLHIDLQLWQLSMANKFAETMTKGHKQRYEDALQKIVKFC